MSTNKTPNYQLSQWVKTDPVSMSDFNADNQIIDAALAAHQSALEAFGNCEIVTGTYTGTGVYDSDNPNTLTFDGQPLLVIVRKNAGTSGSTSDQKLILLWGCDWCNADNSTYTVEWVSWNGNSVSWYNIHGASYQLNASGTIYHYIALLAK